jgi:hypothetical protein
MSKATELAIAEAERAESEPEPEPTPDEPTPDEPPAPEPAADDEDPEFTAKLEQMDREARRHTKAVGKIMGDDFEAFVPCPTCSSGVQGFAPMSALGIPAAPTAGDLKPASDTETCPECDGWGDVLTGAKVERGRIKPCSRCTGTGYIVNTSAPTVPLADGAAQRQALEPPWAAEARAAGYTVIAPYSAPSPPISETGGV